MKQLLALILCLVLSLPVIAAAETESVGPMLDLGDFTLTVGVDDWYEVFSDRQEGMPVALIYPSYDPSRLDSPSITVVWSAGNKLETLEQEIGAEAYAEAMLLYLAGSLGQYGQTVLRQEITECAFTETEGRISLLIVTQDEAADALPVEYHAAFLYRWFEGSGSYIFHLLAPSSEDMATLMACIDTIQLK